MGIAHSTGSDDRTSDRAGGGADGANEHLRPLAEAGLSDRVIWGLVESAPDAIVMTDADGQILLVNRQTEELFGFERSELLGRPVEDLLPREARQVHRAHRTRYRAKPRTRPMGSGIILHGLRKDGREVPVEVSLSPMTGDDGSILVVAAVRDITARVAAEAEARRIQAMLDATRDGVFIFDADSLGFTYVNQGALEQVGYSRDEMLTMTPLHVAPQLTEPELRERLRPLQEGRTESTMFTTVHRRKDGTDLPVEVLVQASATGAGPGSFVAIVRDITERIEAEGRLRAAAQEVRVLEDRERIARDLHDIVIQRLFAAGMSLQALSSFTSDRPDVAARLDTVVDELDETIREIRTAIYGLQAHAERRAGLRQAILTVVDEQSAGLPGEPRLRFDGVLDVVPDELAEHLLATLREALSNVARHAAAGEVSVTVESGPELVLHVVDDGIGIPDDHPVGHGLGNLAARAEALGGSCTVRHVEPHGTSLEWRVPNRVP